MCMDKTSTEWNSRPAQVCNQHYTLVLVWLQSTEVVNLDMKTKGTLEF